MSLNILIIHIQLTAVLLWHRLIGVRGYVISRIRYVCQNADHADKYHGCTYISDQSLQYVSADDEIMKTYPNGTT